VSAYVGSSKKLQDLKDIRLLTRATIEQAATEADTPPPHTDASYMEALSAAAVPAGAFPAGAFPAGASPAFAASPACSPLAAAAFPLAAFPPAVFPQPQQQPRKTPGVSPAAALGAAAAGGNRTAPPPARKRATPAPAPAPAAAAFSVAAPSPAATGKAAVVARRRREKAGKIHAWLLETCEIDDDEELTEILDVFVDPLYGVNSLARLFALEETDMDTILAPLSLSTRRLIHRAWLKERPAS